MNGKSIKSWFCLNAANGITFAGVLLWLVLMWEIFAHKSLITILGISAGIIVTDYFDGKVARYFENKGYTGSVSSFGAAVDRLRDKLFQFTMFFFFLTHSMVGQDLKLAFFLLIVSEVLLLATLFMGIKRKKGVSAGNWGKWKMVLACAGILASLLVLIAKERQAEVPSFATNLLLCTLVASFWFAIMSFKGHLAACRG